MQARTRRLALLALLAIPLAGCTGPAPGPPEGRSLSFVPLEGCDAGQATELSRVVDDAAAWQALWDQACGGGEPPAVDFARSSVVAYFWGEHRTGGVGASVADITEASDHVRILVLRTSPGEGCFVTQAITYPHAIVRTEKLTKAPRFEVEDRTVDC